MLQIAAWLLGAAAAHAAPALVLPHQIGALEYMGEHSPVDASASSSYAYRGAGLALDIDVYDSRPEQLRGGADAPAIRAQLHSVADRMRHALRARIVSESAVQLGTRAHLAAREALFAPDHAAVSLAQSYVWLTASHGHLYSLRLDVLRGFEEDGRVARSEVMQVLGDALASADEEPAATAPALRVAILWDPATPESERKLWTVYLYTRAATAARESSERALPAGERTASFDEELRARRVALGAYRQTLRTEPDYVSSYFADLDRVEAAGFLREYVWRYLKEASWAQPEDLQLTAFDAWRGEHLRDHVPVTHGRVALRLAADAVAQR